MNRVLAEPLACSPPNRTGTSCPSCSHAAAAVPSVDGHAAHRILHRRLLELHRSRRCPRYHRGVSCAAPAVGRPPVYARTHGARKPDERKSDRMTTQVAPTPHGALGLGDDDLVAMYRTVLTARLLDEAALRQNRMGRAPFVVPAEGHEGCQVGTAWAMRARHRRLVAVLPRRRRGARGRHDPVRDLPRHLREGRRPLERRPADAVALGPPRARHHHRVLPIATQVPHAAGIAYAIKYRQEDAVVALLVRRRRHERGRLARGAELRGHPSPAGDLRLREQPLRHQRAAVQADGDHRRGRPRGRATGSRESWSTATTCSRATPR